MTPFNLLQKFAESTNFNMKLSVKEAPDHQLIQDVLNSYRMCAKESKFFDMTKAQMPASPIIKQQLTVERLENAVLPFDSFFFDVGEIDKSDPNVRNGVMMSKGENPHGNPIYQFCVSQAAQTPATPSRLLMFEVVIDRNMIWVSAGLHAIWEGNRFRLENLHNGVFDTRLLTDSEPACRHIVLDAVIMCEFIDNKDKFIVEVEPKVKRKQKKVRQHSVTTYVTLRISEIQKRYKLGLSENTGIKRAPHPVRRHTRTLRAERYKENRGKQIVIPAYWCGEKEATIGDKHYRVLTEK